MTSVFENMDDVPTTTLKQYKSSCVAATVNGTIVTIADDYELGFVFGLIYALCQYRELKLVDADIRFFRADTNPAHAESLADAVDMWYEDNELLDFFNNADIPEIHDINEIFAKMEDFAVVLKGKTLEEIFNYEFGNTPEANSETATEEDVQVRTP